MSLLHAVPKPAPRKKKPRKALRRTWMRKKAPRRIARETPAEMYYKRWIHGEPCVCGCSRPVQQSHLRHMTGASRKENNFMSIAQDFDDHMALTEGRGRFAGMTKFERFAWFMSEIAKAHAAFYTQHGCRPEDYMPTAADRERRC